MLLLVDHVLPVVFDISKSGTSWMAAVGQASSQKPQKMHREKLIRKNSG